MPQPLSLTDAQTHFISGKELMAESTLLLRRNGLITSEAVFVDGTKIEANANKPSEAVFVDGTKIEANANKHDFKTQRGRRPC